MSRILERAALANTQPETLHINHLRRNAGTQMRAELNSNTVIEYSHVMFDVGGWGPFPPAVVYYDGEAYWLADGFHRVAALARIGQTDVLVQVRPGTRRDAILHAAGANAEHGLRRTNADKQRSALALLTDAEWGQWSDREIARRCNVSHEFVRTLRASLSTNDSETATPPTQRTYTTRHGTTATMDTASIGHTAKSKPQAAGTCSRCGRPLTDPDHCAAGIGPICATKREAEIDAALGARKLVIAVTRGGAEALDRLLQRGKPLEEPARREWLDALRDVLE